MLSLPYDLVIFGPESVMSKVVTLKYRTKKDILEQINQKKSIIRVSQRRSRSRDESRRIFLLYIQSIRQNS